MRLFPCPTCAAQHYALFECADHIHRCWSCSRIHAKQYKAPPATKGKRGRVAVLTMIEEKLRHQMREIEAEPQWRNSDTKSAAHFAYAQSIQIVRDHRVITAKGKK